MILLGVIFLIHLSLAAGKIGLAILTENNDGGQRRELTLLPDLITADLTTDDDVIHLTLERMNIAPHSVNVQTNQGKYHVSRERSVGYYHSLNQHAAVMVEAKSTDDKITRIMTGTLVHKNRMYELHPASDTFELLQEIIEQKGLDQSHLVHTLKEVEQSFSHYPDVLMPDADENFNNILPKLDEHVPRINIADRINQSKHSKRQVYSDQKEFHIELMFVVDYSSYDFWLNRLNNHDLAMEEILYQYTHVLNGMQLAYRSIQDSDFSITLWLKELRVVTLPEDEILDETICFMDGNTKKCKVYDGFRKTSAYQNSNNFNWTYPADHITYFIRRDLWARSDSSALYNFNIVGMSPVGRICTPVWSHCINEDHGVLTWYAAAHELAHTLGAVHDEVTANCKSLKGFIMSSGDYSSNQQDIKAAFKFSNCSIENMKNLITGVKDFPRVCVYNKPCGLNQPNTGELPGQKYSLDEQCVTFTGNSNGNTHPCRFYNTNPCVSLYCYNPSTNVCHKFRASIGTPCDVNNQDKVCYRGDCVDIHSIESLSNDNPTDTCSDSTLPVPSDCQDDSRYDCTGMILWRPSYCFLNETWLHACQGSCYKYRLFYANNPRCGNSNNVEKGNNEKATNEQYKNEKSVNDVSTAVTSQIKGNEEKVNINNIKNLEKKLESKLMKYLLKQQNK